VWNQFISSFFKADVGISQRSVLSPILSAFYIVSIFYIFEKRSKILLFPIQASILLFADNVLFISQKKVMKNPTQIFFVVITSFLLYLTSSV